jgi:hypothetical protein
LQLSLLLAALVRQAYYRWGPIVAWALSADVRGHPRGSQGSS